MQFDIRQSLPRVRYSFSCDASPDRVWDVRRVELVEELSRPYELVLDLLTDGLDLDADALLVGNGELVLDREVEVRTVCGVITRVEIADPTEDAVPVRLVLKPALALLDQRVDTRMWPYTSARKVVEAVLDAALIDYGREVDLSHLLDTWRVRPGVTQYQESDLAVVSRLLEGDGIAYHFDHERGSGREVLVLENTADHWEPVPTPDGEGILPVIEARHDQAEVESLQQLRWRREAKPNAVARQMFDWQHPIDPTLVERQAEGEGPRREVYQHVRLLEDDYEARVISELADLRAGARVLTGVGNAIGFAPGRRFRVDPSSRPEFADYEFLITKVVTHGDCPDVQLGAEAGEDRFRNEFECVVLDGEAWQPPRQTPIPRVHGPLTAIVVGPEGEEIHVDPFGRVQVRFDWDRVHGLHDESSMWIRVAHGWAGAGFGVLFTPRIGMEVVVEFIAGDPARPLITGCVYNGDAQPTVEVENNPTQSTIRTRSSPGGKGYNELRFEDAAGSEEVFLHAQRNLREVIGSDHTTTVGGDCTQTVEGDFKQEVSGDHTVRIGGKLKQTVVGEHVYDYEKARTVTSYDADTLHVLGPALRDYQQGLKRTIQGRRETKVTSGQGLIAASVLEVEGQILHSSTTKQNLLGEISAQLAQGKPNAVPEAHVTVEGGGVSAKGGFVEVRADRSAKMIAGDELFLEGSGKALLQQNTTTKVLIENNTITISATEIVLEASKSSIKIGPSGITINSPGVVDVTGSMVKIN